MLPDLLDDGPELYQPLHGPVALDLLALALPGQQVRQVAVVAEGKVNIVITVIVMVIVKTSSRAIISRFFTISKQP